MEEGSHLSCRVLRAWAAKSARFLVSQHPARGSKWGFKGARTFPSLRPFDAAPGNLPAHSTSLRTGSAKHALSLERNQYDSSLTGYRENPFNTPVRFNAPRRRTGRAVTRPAKLGRRLRFDSASLTMRAGSIISCGNFRPFSRRRRWPSIGHSRDCFGRARFATG